MNGISNIRPNTAASRPSFGAYPLYAITSSRQVMKFDSVQAALEKINVTGAQIYNNLSPGNNSRAAGNLVFKKEHEIFDNYGKLDMKKVKKFAEALKSVCIIDKHLNIYTPIDRKDAMHLLSMPRPKLQHYLTTKTMTPQGKLIVAREDIEDEFGNLVPEKAQKLRDQFKAVQHNDGFYTVSKTGEVAFQPNWIEFANQTGKTQREISQCLAGKTKSVSGHLLLKRSDIENKNGEIDHKRLKAKINELRPEPQDKKTNGKVLAINKNKAVKLYDSVDAALKDTGMCYETLKNILSGKRTHTRQGWHYVYANDLRDETGRIPTQKIKERFQEIFKDSN